MPSGPMPDGSTCRNSGSHRYPCRRRPARRARRRRRSSLPSPKVRGLDAFRLDALLVARFRIVAGLGGLVFEGRAGFVEHLALLREDGEAARAALVVAFIGNHEAVVVEPFHGVGLAQRRPRPLPSKEIAPSFLVSTFSSVTLPAGKCETILPLAASTITMWLFSCSVTRDLVRLVEGDEFRFGILRRHGSDAGEVDRLDGVAVGHAGAERHDLQIAGRQLRDFAVVQLLVALVLDGDRGEGAVLADGDEVRLSAEIAGLFDRPAGEVDDGEIAGRLGLALGGVDARRAPCRRRRRPTSARRRS